MMNQINKKDAADINLLLATFRCFNEQLYLLKGIHSGAIKQKFNRLIRVANQYEKEITKIIGDDPQMNQIYDDLMDVMVAIKDHTDGQKQTNLE